MAYRGIQKYLRKFHRDRWPEVDALSKKTLMIQSQYLLIVNNTKHINRISIQNNYSLEFYQFNVDTIMLTDGKLNIELMLVNVKFLVLQISLNFMHSEYRENINGNIILEVPERMKKRLGIRIFKMAQPVDYYEMHTERPSCMAIRSFSKRSASIVVYVFGIQNSRGDCHNPAKLAGPTRSRRYALPNLAIDLESPVASAKSASVTVSAMLQSRALCSVRARSGL